LYFEGKVYQEADLRLACSGMRYVFHASH